MNRILLAASIFIAIVILLVVLLSNFDFTYHQSGDIIDSFNNVNVFYNGIVKNTFGKNVSSDGYYIGHKYQCVEFVKRYYFDFYHHKMPDPYGNAKDFFNNNLSDGSINKQRNLFQYKNGSISKPKEGDLIVLGPYIFNKYGHVAIISKINKFTIEIIQQNPGPFGKTRIKYGIAYRNNKWFINNKRVLGWLSLY